MDRETILSLPKYKVYDECGCLFRIDGEVYAGQGHSSIDEHKFAYLVEKKIKAMGLTREYSAILNSMTQGERFDRLIHIEPEKRCRAALLTVMEVQHEI